jgi:hypothetical protein
MEWNNTFRDVEGESSACSCWLLMQGPDAYYNSGIGVTLYYACGCRVTVMKPLRIGIRTGSGLPANTNNNIPTKYKYRVSTHTEGTIK